MQIIRVFPRRTKATPTDEMAYIGNPTLFAEADKVMVSVAFTWDIPEAERLAEAWKVVAPVEIGGPAYDEPGGKFEPGMFLKEGYTITSRGCPNKCWFCNVWKRDGAIRELPIKDGWIITDDNLLACSESHIRAVFAMLKRQPHKAEFTGGLEASRLSYWFIDLLMDVKPKRIYFAYDEPADYEALYRASKLLQNAGFKNNSHMISCYNLIGYPKDTFDSAEKRLKETLELGFTPFAMLWRGKDGKTNPEWRKFQRQWARPTIIYGRKDE